jgi:hypothetical protein
MRRGSLFGGVVLLLIGSLFLLNNFGVLSFNVWSTIGPLMLIALGVWVMAGRWIRPSAGEPMSLSVPLKGTQKAKVRIAYGAGRLNVHGGAGEGLLASGLLYGGADTSMRRTEEGQELRLSSSIDFPWGWDHGRREWDVSLNNTISLALQLEAGASENHIDLTETRITDLRIETGASDTKVWLPAHAGSTRVTAEAGAASLEMHIPEGVAARIKSEGALMDVKIDQARFPRQGSSYQSKNYDTAENRVDIQVEAGVGSLKII